MVLLPETSALRPATPSGQPKIGLNGRALNVFVEAQEVIGLVAQHYVAGRQVPVGVREGDVNAVELLQLLGVALGLKRHVLVRNGRREVDLVGQLAFQLQVQGRVHEHVLGVAEGDAPRQIAGFVDARRGQNLLFHREIIVAKRPGAESSGCPSGVRGRRKRGAVNRSGSTR